MWNRKIVTASIASPAYVAVSFPIMLIYGVVTSWCSDWLANRLSSKRFRWFTSFVLHILFGLVLSWLSLLAATLFYLVDRLLQHRGDITKPHTMESLLIPIGYLLIVTGSVYIIDVIQDLFVRFNFF